MKLKLVKHGEFLGTVCDFYLCGEDSCWRSGKAYEYYG